MKSAERNKQTYRALQQFQTLLERRITKTIMSKTLLTYSQFQVLKIIADSHLSTQDSIAFILGISQPAVSKQVRLLLERELIHATSAASDRRKTILHVTSRGKVQLKKAVTLIEEQLEALLGNLSSKSRLSLERSLNTLTVSLLLSVDG